MRSTKCRHCKKYLGESFKDFPDGTIDDGTYYYCDSICELVCWSDCWGRFTRHEECVDGSKITEFGRGYRQAMRDINDKAKLYVNVLLDETGGKDDN